MAKDRVEIEILAEVKQAVSGVKEFLGAIGALSVAFGTATKFYKAAFDEYAASERTLRKLSGTLKATGYSAGYSASQFADMAGELSKMTGIDDDVIINAQAVLTTFTRLGRNVFPDAMQAAMDMSAVMGTDLQGAVVQVGKALQDPILGVTALRKAGVSFTEEQQKQIKSLVEQNKLFEAQTLILNELKGEFGGVATMMGDTVAGSVDKLKNAWGNWMSAFGKEFATNSRPIMDFFSRILESDTAAVERNQAVRQAIEARKTGAPVENAQKALEGLRTDSWTRTLGKSQADLEVFLASYARYEALGMAAAQQRAQAAAEEAAKTAALQAQIDKINEAYGKTPEGVRAATEAQLKFWESFDLKEWPQNAAKIQSIIAGLREELHGVAAVVEIPFFDELSGFDPANLQLAINLLDELAKPSQEVSEYFNALRADPFAQLIASGEVATDVVVKFADAAKSTIDPIKEMETKVLAVYGTISPVFESLGQAIMEGADGWAAFADAAKNAVATALQALAKMWATEAAAMLVPGITFNPAGAAGLFGMSAAALIASGVVKSLAHGGEFTTNGPEMIRVGDNASGRERVRVTPLDQSDDTPIHLVINLDGRPIADFVTRASRRRQILIDGGSVV